jgi:GAF domain-containing protein
MEGAVLMAQLDISPEILDALQKLSALLETEDSLERTLQTVVDLSVEVLPGCDAAGVTLRVKGQDRTAAASDAYTLSIDNIQYESGEGPCVQALERNEVVRIDDISQETRWPGFTKQAAQQQLRSTLSHPLHEDGTIGALNLYSKTERAFDERATAISGIFAKQASIALQNAHTYMVARNLSDQLNDALRSRDVIGQAKGILMEREGILGDEAFEMLRHASQNANVKLRDVAQRVVDEKKRAD